MTNFGRYVVIGKEVYDRKENPLIGISFDDLLVMRGWSVAEIGDARGKIPFHWDYHRDRLQFSANKVGIDLSNIPLIANGELENTLSSLLERNGFNESMYYIRCTPGVPDDGWISSGHPQIYINVNELKRKKDPVEVITDPYKRQLADVKHPDYLHGAMKLSKMRNEGRSQHILYVHPEDDHILEAPGQNICFVLKNGRVLAPELYNERDEPQVLDGITLKVIYDLLNNNPEFVGVRGKITPKKVDKWIKNGFLDGALLISSARVVPIEQIDSMKLQTGELTEKVRAMFESYRERYFASRSA